MGRIEILRDVGRLPSGEKKENSVISPNRDAWLEHARANGDTRAGSSDAMPEPNPGPDHRAGTAYRPRVERVAALPLLLQSAWLPIAS